MHGTDNEAAIQYNRTQRTAEDISSEIAELQSQIAQEEQELTKLESRKDDVSKAKLNNPEWEAARRSYIDTGDMSGVNNWYNRYDQRKRDADNLQLRRDELANANTQKANTEATANAEKLKSRKQAAEKAIAAYNDEVEIFTNDNTSDNDRSKRYAKRTMDNAIADYIDAGGSRDDLKTVPYSGEVETEDGGAKLTANDKRRFEVFMSELDREAKKGKILDSDYENAVETAALFANSPDFSNEGIEWQKKLDKLASKTESGIKDYNSKRDAAFEDINKGDTSVARMNRWKAFKKKYPKYAESFEFYNGNVRKKEGL